MGARSGGLTGSIIEEAPGRWTVRLSLGRDPLTKQPRNLKRRIRGTRKDAEKALAQLHLDPRAKARPTGAPRTVAELLDRHISHLEQLGRETLTVADYRDRARRLGPLIGSVRPDQLGPGTIEEALRRLEVAPATQRRYLALISGAMRRAVRLGWVDAQVTDRVELPRAQRYIAQPPELVDVLRVIDTMVADGQHELAVAVWLAAATGCRRGELCGLQWGDLDGERLTVRRAVIEVPGGGWAAKGTKTHAERRIVLDPGTMARLEAHRAWQADQLGGGDPPAWILADLLVDDGNAPHRPEWLTNGWRAYAKEAGVVGRLHDLRHLHASILLAEGMPVRDVAQRVGHASPTTTLGIYAHVLEGRDRAAADIMGRLMS